MSAWPPPLPQKVLANASLLVEMCGGGRGGSPLTRAGHGHQSCHHGPALASESLENTTQLPECPLLHIPCYHIILWGCPWSCLFILPWLHGFKQYNQEVLQCSLPKTLNSDEVTRVPVLRFFLHEGNSLFLKGWLVPAGDTLQ